MSLSMLHIYLTSLHMTQYIHTFNNITSLYQHFKFGKILTNQIKILSNQIKILTNQIKILTNQIKILSNQIKILTNQIKILTNQIKILTNQIKILSNQIKLHHTTIFTFSIFKQFSLSEG